MPIQLRTKPCPPMPENPSKPEELAHYRAFLASLRPGSYLYQIFANSDKCMEDLIYKDSPMPPFTQFPSLTKERDTLANQVKELLPHKQTTEEIKQVAKDLLKKFGM